MTVAEQTKPAFDFLVLPEVSTLKHGACQNVALAGVHHTARPTWKLEETITFYRDVLGLPLVQCISANGWGPDDHPDFLHFFFSLGNGAALAFFYYLGTEEPQDARPENGVFDNATHTAWRVTSRDELLAWREALQQAGITVSKVMPHEGIEAIYFTDPNGYLLEITTNVRDVDERDINDADLLLETAIELERAAFKANETVPDIETVWRAKGQKLEQRLPI